MNASQVSSINAPLPPTDPPSPVSTSPLEAATLPPSPPVEAHAPPGYEILGVLGRGGMGVVYQARQVRLQRNVAVKMILAGGHAGEEALARFRTEAEAVARLQHPGVVQIYEVGEWRPSPDGPPLPFLALEFCPGGSLEKKLAGTPQPPPDAAALVEKLARAMAVAHHKGIVHRDLKPANVLFGEDGTPKVTDFGLAKKLDEQGQTQTGAIMGTPSYMAPEQAGGSSKEIGPAADVWALGATLYECLTGRPPFKAATPMDTVLQVLTEEPVPPSRLLPHCPADVETICLKCLHKDPRKRYASAEDLAEDLRRFLAGEPIVARPVGPAERAWRWCRRNPVVAGLTAAVAAVLLAGTGVASGLAVWALGERDRADLNAATAHDNEQDALRRKGEAEKAQAQAEQERELKDRQLTRAEWLVYGGQIERALGHWQNGKVWEARDALLQTRWDYRDWEHRHLHTLFNASQRVFQGHESTVYSVCFSPDGKRIASAGGTPPQYDRTRPPRDGEVKVWDARTRRPLLSLRGLKGDVTCVCFSPDGKRIAAGGGGFFFFRNPNQPGEVKVWDADSGQEVLSLKGHTGGITGVCFSPDGKRIASAGQDGTVRVWGADQGLPLLTLQGRTGPLTGVCFSPDGRRLATGGAEGKVWDADGGQEIFSLKGHKGHVYSVCFSPDGKRLASGGGDNIADNTAKVWDADTGKELFSLKGHTRAVKGVCFSPDGTRLATGGDDETVKVWSVYGGPEQLSLKGHTDGIGGITGVCFSPDGRRLASASADWTVRLWDVAPVPLPLSPGGRGTAGSVCFSPDGRRIAVAGGGQDRGQYFGDAAVRDVRSGQTLLTLSSHSGSFGGVCFSPDGKRLATVSSVWDALKAQAVKGEVKLWDAVTGRVLLALRGPTDAVTGVCFSPDGGRLATAGHDGVVRLWDAQTGREVRALKGHSGHVYGICFSPDGKRLASAGGVYNPFASQFGPGEVKVWDVQSGESLLSLTVPGQSSASLLFCICFSPDGKRLACGGMDWTVEVLDAHSGQRLRTLEGHIRNVRGVCFSPDGKRLASTSDDGTVRVWEVEHGQHVLTLPVQGAPSTAVCFSPDGKLLAGTGTVWEASSGPDALALEGQPGDYTRVGFSPDGKRITAGVRAGGVRAWDARTGQPVIPCTDPAPPDQREAASPDDRLVVRIQQRLPPPFPPVGQPFAQPRDFHPDHSFEDRLEDPARQHQWHLRMSLQSRSLPFARRFHLEGLLLTAFTRWAGRPRDSIPLWAWRPPLVVLGRPAGFLLDRTLYVQPGEVEGLLRDLSRRQEAQPDRWEVRAARGWCRYLLGDLPGAADDLKQAIRLHPDEPGLWALLGVVSLKHNRPDEAEAARKRLADWPGLDVGVWHEGEATVCEGEEAWAEAYWHLSRLLEHLPTPPPALLVRRGYVSLELGRAKDAAADFARAAREDEKNLGALFWHTRACLAAGDTEGYRHGCAALQKLYASNPDPSSAQSMLRTFVLAPEPAVDLGAALKIVEYPATDAFTLTTQGGLLLRAGRYPEAVKRLQQASAGRRDSEAPVADLLLAIAQHKQGQGAEARRTLGRACWVLDQSSLQQAAGLLGGAAIGPWQAAVAAAMRREPPRWDWPTKQEVHLLRLEAERLIGRDPSQPEQ